MNSNGDRLVTRCGFVNQISGLRSIPWTLVIAGGILLAGCDAAQKTPSVSSVSADVHPAPTGEVPDRPIEVVEKAGPDGTVLTRIEGWRDEDGNFVYHGKLINLWETGQKKSEVHYVNGIRHGLRAAWYRDGTPWNHGEFVDGKAHGTWTEWLSNGAKGRETHYINGGLNGWLIEWFPDGTMKRKVMYVDGLRQGRETHWDREQTILRETDYVDDVAQP